MTRRMRIACCILKATNTHSEYVIFIDFSLQEWLQKRASMLRYEYIVSPVRFMKQLAKVSLLLKYETGSPSNFFLDVSMEHF